MLTPIGTTNHQNKNIPFGVNYKDRGGHIYAIGKTGMGKSTLLQNMALFDISQGKGVCIIDPHGDTCKYILERIPVSRQQDIIFINPSIINQETFNPIHNIPKEHRFIISSHITTVFKKLWSDSWGPRLEHILRHAINTLTYYPECTLLDICPLLTDIHYRTQILQYVDNKVLQRFWEKEFNSLTPQQRNEHIAPILNKVGILTSNPIISAVIGSTPSTLSIKDCMDNSKIVIANLSKGILGEEGTQFLGALLVTLFQVTAMRRASIPYTDRVPFFLYVDEMHSFVTLSFADILSEARKYGLGLFLTHQFLDQIHEDIRKAILGNVGTIICFRLGSNDAEIMEKEFFPVFTKEDFVSLPQFHIYLKLLIDGTVSQGFSARILSRTEVPSSKYLN